ncbi:aldehyde dehydrogenase family protein [Propionibacteriaceae bacterium Y1923]
MTTIDKDLRSVQQARDLASRAREAMRQFQFTDQDSVDRICRAMVDAAMAEAQRLGRMAHAETGFGHAAHKQLKNEFAAKNLWDSIKDEPTCGVLRRDDVNKVVEIGWPVGVVVALTPSTNPTSTAIFKVLIAVKARNAIVVAPHPSAKDCTAEAVRVLAEAGERVGMPKGLVTCMTELSLEGTNELMNHYATSLILATGGPGMVKAAHSVGKPAIGVGPGNVPVWVDRSADIKQAARMIVESKSFDCSTICATEQLIIADAPIADQLRAEIKAAGAHWLSADEAKQLGNRMFRPNGMMVAGLVGRTPQYIAEQTGLRVPDDARILVADLDGIGPENPLSREKLTTVLGFMVADGWKAGFDLAGRALRFGGDGHTAVIHSRDEEQVLQFGIEQPAFRLLVNTWGSLGAVGATTTLDPSMTLAPGGVGGAVVSDNITLRHVLNTKRLAYHATDAPAVARAHRGLEGGAAGSSGASGESRNGIPRDANAEAIERIVAKVLAEMGR